MYRMHTTCKNIGNIQNTVLIIFINKSLFNFHLFNCFRNMNLYKYPNVLSFITKLYIYNKYQYKYYLQIV